MNKRNARNGDPAMKRAVKRKSIFSLPVLLLGLVVFSAVFLVIAHNMLPKDITLVVDGVATEYSTRSNTVAEFLAENNISITAEDVIEPGLEESLTQNEEIRLQKAIAVEIVADGESKTIRHIPATVVEFLHMADISLGENDLLSIPKETALTESTQVVVTRVTKEVKSFQQEIAYRQERQDDPKLERGVSRVVSRGQNGLKETTVELVYHDGELVERNTIAEEVLKKPVNKVVAYGTISTVSRGGQTFDFREVKTVKAYAYTGGGRTASGTNARVGAIAVDPKVIPLGTKVYVEGYGFATAEDTGGNIKGNTIDLYMDTESQCLTWGIKTVKVYILQ